MRRLLLTVGVLLALAAPAAAQVQQRLPTSDSATYNEWNASGGGSKFADVDDTIGADDADSTYISKVFGSLPAVQAFGFTAFSITSSAITNVQVVAIARQTGADGQLRGGLRIGAGPVNDYQSSAQALSGSYTTYTFTFATNPQTTSAWTEAEVEGTDGTNPLVEFYVRGQSASSGELRITNAYLVVNYTAAGGGVSPTSVMLPLTGVGQ